VQLMREGYHEQLFLLTNERGEPIVRKQAKPRPDGTLLTEIAWLEELPPTAVNTFLVSCALTSRLMATRFSMRCRISGRSGRYCLT
jgi:hypothetical protein